MKLKRMEGKFYYHGDYPHYHPMFPVCLNIQSLRRMLSPKSRTVRTPKGWARRRSLRNYLETISLHSTAPRRAPGDRTWKALVLLLGFERKGRRKPGVSAFTLILSFPLGLPVYFCTGPRVCLPTSTPLKARDTEVSHCPKPATVLELRNLNKTLPVHLTSATLCSDGSNYQEWDAASWRPDHLAGSPFLPSLK